MDTMKVVLYETEREGEVLGDQSLPEIYKRLVSGEIVSTVGHKGVFLLREYAATQGRRILSCLIDGRWCMSIYDGEGL
jgi:hypothetical protein